LIRTIASRDLVIGFRGLSRGFSFAGRRPRRPRDPALRTRSFRETYFTRRRNNSEQRTGNRPNQQRADYGDWVQGSDTSGSSRATERIDLTNSAQGTNFQGFVTTASDGPHRPNQRCALAKIYLEATDRKDSAVTGERRTRIDPKIDPQLVSAISISECGIGSPTRARTWDLRINTH
jgi:hypothetical protein